MKFSLLLPLVFLPVAVFAQPIPRAPSGGYVQPNDPAFQLAQRLSTDETNLNFAFNKPVPSVALTFSVSGAVVLRTTDGTWWTSDTTTGNGDINKWRAVQSYGGPTNHFDIAQPGNPGSPDYFGVTPDTMTPDFYIQPVSSSLAFSNDVAALSNTLATALADKMPSSQTNGTNIAFTLVRTNFNSGQLYTNNYGAPVQLSANAVVTTAAVAGAAKLDLRINSVPGTGLVTNTVGGTTLATTLVVTATNSISGFVPAGGTYTFTNTSTGAGNSAGVYGGQILVY